MMMKDGERHVFINKNAYNPGLRYSRNQEAQFLLR